MQKKNICVRLDEKTIKQLQELADKKHRTISDLVRLIILNFLEQVEL